jgi:L-lactate dehydrogenase (cytochrome)
VEGPADPQGLLDPEDAREAVDLGADGIVVSNHGGRQLDGALSTARALPPIADAVRDGLTVLADGGVRSGLDVVRMLALGADGVLLGRAWAYALAARARRAWPTSWSFGRRDAVAMALTGVTSVDAIDRNNLAEWSPA